MRILGIDYGTRRVGLSVSDALGIIAQGLETLKHPGSLDLLLKKIEEVACRHHVTEFVVGLPLNMNGTKGEKAREAETFAEHLGRIMCLPVHLWDERLTTVSVERDLSRWKVGIQKKKLLRDRLSAQLILQSYLDFQRSQPKS